MNMNTNSEDLYENLSAEQLDVAMQFTLDPTMKKRRQGELSIRVMNYAVSSQSVHADADINSFLEELINTIAESGSLTGRLSSSPGDKAFDIIFEAWRASPSEKIDLAKKALEIDKDCADAYILLAEEAASSAKERCAYYLEALLASERQLGFECFKYNSGEFWQIVKTRPHMRAKAGLAESLMGLGDRLRSVEQYKQILRLNPIDNQAARYQLFNLLVLDREEHWYLAELFERYNSDRMAHYLYTRALWLYARNKTAPANFALRTAYARNPYVPVYLLGLRPLPEVIPSAMAPGSAEEAASYASLAQTNWQNVPGALGWLGRKIKMSATIIEKAIQFKAVDEEESEIFIESNALMPFSLV